MARIAAGAVDTSRHDSILRRENSNIPNKHFLFYIKIMISTIYWFFSSSSKLYKRFHNIVQTFQIRDYQTKIRELNFSKKKL